MYTASEQAALMKFGARLRFLREQKGFTLRELSYASKVDNSKISKMESGKINITLLTLLDLASALEISPMSLLDIDENNL
jgi:transcriptional regulator with XRE-family HTH domain